MPRTRFSDAEVLSVIRRHRKGETYSALSAELGISEETMQSWCDGTNRGHLLARVEREERNAA
jgi:hypothetical protein